MHQLRLSCITSMIVTALTVTAASALPNPTAERPAIIVAQATATPTGVQPTATLPTPVQFYLGLGGAQWDIDGNEKRFRQYVTPPERVFLSQLAAYRFSDGGHSLLDLAVTDLGAPSAAGAVWLGLDNGDAVLRSIVRQSTFFPDWDADSAAAKRSDTYIDLSGRTGTGELRVIDRNVQQNDAEESWTLNAPAVRYTTGINGWRAGIGYRDESFDFASGPLLNGNTHTLAMRVATPDSGSTQVEASAAFDRTSLEAPGFSQPGHTRVGLEGVHILGRNATLTGLLSHDEITHSIAENAYATRDTDGQLRLTFDGVPNTTVDVGGGAHRVGYINNEQTILFNAIESDYFVKSRMRVTRWLTLNAGLTHRRTTNRPITVNLFENTSGSLVWSSKDDQRVEVTLSPYWRMGATARYRRLVWKNTDFDAKNSLGALDLFGWWLPIDRLTVYGGYLRQAFELNGIEQTRPYTTDDHAITAGISYQLAHTLVLDADYTNTKTWGFETNTQRTYGLGLNYRWLSGDSLGIRAVRDDFTGTTPTLDYDGNRYEVRYTKAIY